MIRVLVLISLVSLSGCKLFWSPSKMAEEAFARDPNLYKEYEQIDSVRVPEIQKETEFQLVADTAATDSLLASYSELIKELHGLQSGETPNVDPGTIEAMNSRLWNLTQQFYKLRSKPDSFTVTFPVQIQTPDTSFQVPVTQTFQTDNQGKVTAILNIPTYALPIKTKEVHIGGFSPSRLQKILMTGGWVLLALIVIGLILVLLKIKKILPI